jgi:amidophosphoribosyltransferase
VWAGRNVHHVRQRLGEQLAIESGVDADVVIPVPDSSIPPPSATAGRAASPHNDGLIKNRYIGRTFIEPTQDLRERGVALKFNALTENLAGKRVVMIDDSLVRGTTAGPLVKLLRDAGATEVHLRITCPPITHACHFGVDMGHDGDLMAARLTVEEMRDHIGADSLAFLSLDGMMRAIEPENERQRAATATPASPAATRCPSTRPSPSSASKACSHDLMRPCFRVRWASVAVSETGRSAQIPRRPDWA